MFWQETCWSSDFPSSGSSKVSLFSPMNMCSDFFFFFDWLFFNLTFYPPWVCWASRLWLCGLLNFINFWKSLVIIFLIIFLPCFVCFLNQYFQSHICYTIWHLFTSYKYNHTFFNFFSLYVSVWIISIYLSASSLIISSVLSSMLIFWNNSLSWMLIFLYLFFKISIYFSFHIWRIRTGGITYLTES